MNIARELGSLLSGLLGPQTTTATRQVGKSLQDRSRASSKGNQRLQNPAQAGNKGNDRITLSRTSRALLESSLDPASKTDEEPSSHSGQVGQLPALPQPDPPAYPFASFDPYRDDLPSTSNGMTGTGAMAESPATRQRVRTTYGNPDVLSSDAVPLAAGKIDLHA